MIEAFTGGRCIAYFSMEIALESEIPTYSGGLGVLAGDTVRSAADLTIPLVAVTLASHQGYFRQSIDPEGRQHEDAALWNIREHAKPLNAKVAVAIEGREVWVAGWLYVLTTSPAAGRRPVILLDTRLDENSEADRMLTDHLYGDDADYRLRQEIILGIGGVRLLRALGFTIAQYHMNEGHSALLALELVREHAIVPSLRRPGEPLHDINAVRESCCFTTHTPVEAGHDKFSYELVQRLLDGFIDLDVIKRFAGPDALNMTRLALNLSEYVNGVAQRHAQVSAAMFPGYTMHAVTNGIHPYTWTSPPFRALYDRHFPGWHHEPEILMRADCCIPRAAIWSAHVEAKAALLAFVEQRSGRRLDPDCAILGFARRMTAYKRPTLLFEDLARLRAIAGRTPVQIILAGKAHPQDRPGRDLIHAIHEAIQSLSDAIAVVYLQDYDMAMAQALVAGVDVWLNTPAPPREASGTSGMKACFNGVPSLSVLDGWWLEGCIEGVTGWAIGTDRDRPDGGDAQALYDKLGDVVLPLYYNDREAWIGVMQGAIAKNASFFHSHRMMRRYAAEAYLR